MKGFGEHHKSNEKKASNKTSSINEAITFPVALSIDKLNEDISISTNTSFLTSKEQIITQAYIFHNQGNISEAKKYYEYVISQGFSDPKVFFNYATLLKSLGKLHEAELSTRKSIELNPDFAFAHANLGNILSDLGKWQEAELSQRRAVELNPYLAEAHSNLGNTLRELGRLKEAEMSLLNAIKLKPDLAFAHFNLGLVLRDFGKSIEAEISLHKAIKLNPQCAKSYSTLGSILLELGKFEEAELILQKAIIINPDLTEIYYSLSKLKKTFHNKIWLDNLFSAEFLKNKSQVKKIDIYFARANILHKKKIFEESSRYLKLANKLKNDLNPSKSDIRFNKSKLLLIESDKRDINLLEETQSPTSIFIVGMPRSGSTLLESILSRNSNVNDLGEINLLEESFLEHKKINQKLTLAELYWNKVKNHKSELTITTNKWLYNYQYTGIIAKEIPNAKIIHCYRNPLDNILSLYRTHFTKANDYSSSLTECARVYLDQDKIMTEYKNRYRSKIYDLNYDLLVNNSSDEIKSLIDWLDWEWNEAYLSPHLNPRSVSTASSVQVRSPINPKSIGGWKNYKDMLRPAIEILKKTDKYHNVDLI